MAYVPKEALDGNALFEGYHRKLPDGGAAPYLCPARVATIGYGTTRYPSGRAVRLQDPPITKETAREYMANDLQIAAKAVDNYARVLLHDLQRSALIMFTNNCGTGALQHSTLLWAVNRKDWPKAGREFLKWVNGGGQRLTGLVRRRQYESEMFLRGAALLGDKPEAPSAPAVPMPQASAPRQKQSWWSWFWPWRE